MKRRITAEFRTPDDEPLTAADAFAMLEEVPGEARLSAIHVDKGTPRDSWLIFVGMRAEWEES